MSASTMVLKPVLEYHHPCTFCNSAYIWHTHFRSYSLY